MQCLLLLLTQARQCAVLHHALAASRAFDNCPPIDTRHRSTAPQHLHLHARGGQRRRPTCSCAGQCASNRPAVRHVEDDAALEAVDENPRGPGPGKTGAVGAGARPRRSRSCCSAATPLPAPKVALLHAIEKSRFRDDVASMAWGSHGSGPQAPSTCAWPGITRRPTRAAAAARRASLGSVA